MATEILKSFSFLQNELEEAKSSLKGVDENIKRLIGRDPSELPPRLSLKRAINDKAVNPISKLPRRGLENDDITTKRRNLNSVSVFKRLSEKVYEEPIKTQQRGLISKVIAAPKEIPSRQDAMDKQSKDEKFKARNRRMFGALLGTLQKFQQEETKLKKKEEKRIQIEKKIEEHEMQEKEEIKKERQELFLNRRKKQQEIKMIELKMLRMKEYAAWEESQKPRTRFILTKAKPHIHYLPRRINDKSKELIEKSKKDVEEHIEKKRQAVFDELNHIEERMKKNFENKAHNQETKEEVTNIRHGCHHSDNESDDDGDVKMKSPDVKEEKDKDPEISDKEKLCENELEVEKSEENESVKEQNCKVDEKDAEVRQTVTEEQEEVEKKDSNLEIIGEVVNSESVSGEDQKDI